MDTQELQWFINAKEWLDANWGTIILVLGWIFEAIKNRQMKTSMNNSIVTATKSVSESKEYQALAKRYEDLANTAISHIEVMEKEVISLKTANLEQSDMINTMVQGSNLHNTIKDKVQKTYERVVDNGEKSISDLTANLFKTVSKAKENKNAFAQGLQNAFNTIKEYKEDAFKEVKEQLNTPIKEQFTRRVE
jgi:N-acetylglutamate synthase/N-acetylornithine aminotransferase